MKNISLKDLPAKLMPLLETGKRYLALVFLMLFLAGYGFLVFRINSLAQSEPSDDAVAEKLQTTQRPRIDQNAVDKIEDLKEQNVQAQTLFEEARQNPFAE